MHPEDLTTLLHQHPFTADMAADHLQTLLGCASLVRFDDGEYLLHEGEIAERLYLIRAGRVALDISLNERGAIRVQTVGSGEVLGWSWLISPFRWHFDGCAIDTVRAIALDGTCLRAKCERDHDFGYAMLKRLTLVMQSRLQATRLQLLDVYGPEAGVHP